MHKANKAIIGAGAEDDKNKVVGEGTSKAIVGPDGKFKGLILDKRYAQRRRWSKLTRLRRGEDRFEHEFLIDQLMLLGKPGAEDAHHNLLLESISKILSQNRFPAKELLSRYCVFVPILDAIRQILTAPDDTKADNLRERFDAKIHAARKELRRQTRDADEDGPQEKFIRAVETLWKMYDREPTMAEVGEHLFPEKSFRNPKGDLERRRIRVSQLARETGFKLPRQKPKSRSQRVSLKA